MPTLLSLVYMFSASFIPFTEKGMDLSPTGIEYVMDKQNSTSVNFMLGLDVLDLVTVYGGEYTEQIKNQGSLSFNPYLQQYYCGLDVHYQFNEGFRLSAGLYRQCTHPVNAWQSESKGYDSASLDIYIRAEGKIKLF